MRLKLSILIFALTGLLSVSVAAQNQPAQAAKQLPIEEIIKRFAIAESENKAARNNYAFTQDVNLMTLGEAGSVTGQFRRVSDIVLDDRGNRVERITHFPPNTLQVGITKEDLHDLANVQPFGLTIEELPKYNVNYIGKEKIDEINTYVFDVKPKKLVKGERYFEGKVWVDDVDLQIVKAAGQAVPEDKDNQYPKFESYRENVDGRYWFPTYIAVDDTLEFKNYDVRFKGTIKLTNYKKFSTGIRIADDDEGELADEEKKAGDKIKKPEEQKPGDKKPDSQSSPTKKPEPPPVKKKPDGN